MAEKVADLGSRLSEELQSHFDLGDPHPQT